MTFSIVARLRQCQHAEVNRSHRHVQAFLDLGRSLVKDQVLENAVASSLELSPIGVQVLWILECCFFIVGIWLQEVSQELVTSLSVQPTFEISSIRISRELAHIVETDPSSRANVVRDL